MIGLFFFTVIGLWAAIAVTLGIKIPVWLGAKRYRPVLAFVLIPVIFLLPVLDEVIAWPQMKALCNSVNTYRYDVPTSTGKTVSKYAYVLNRESKILFPSVTVKITEYGLRSVEDGEPIVRWTVIESSGGFLHFPAGSSGTRMSLILPESCSAVPHGRTALKEVKERLKLNESDVELPIENYVIHDITTVQPVSSTR